MYYLKLSNTDVLAVIDDEDAERIQQRPWSFHYSEGRGSGTIQSKKDGRTISLASEVMKKPGRMFDHKDRNPFNNQKENLRKCTLSQNCCNRNRKNVKLTSIYRGVFFAKDRNKWRASIEINGNNIHLGQFSLEKDAALAYNNAAIIHHKEFASLNIIND